MNVFPALTGQTFFVSKAPTFSTTVKKAASGRQVRGSLQSGAIWAFKVGYGYLRDKSDLTSELKNLWAFFCVAKGQFAQFYFLDPWDNIVTGQQVGVADGISNTYQLSRTVGGSTAYPYTEAVYGVNGLPTVYLNGVATTAFSVGAYGTLAFNSPPAKGAVISWTGSFLFLCHFTQDDVSPSQMVKNMWSLDGLTFESLLP